MPVMSTIEGAFCRSRPWRSFARRAVVPWALDGHPLRGDVLEVGGGSGAMAIGVARAFPDVAITVTDVDQAMVDAARFRLADLPNVNVESADVTALPFETDRFDAVTSYLMLHHVINWVDALAEIARVLKPGGAFIGYDLTSTPVARLIHKADRSAHRIIAPDELADGLAVAGLMEVTIRLSVAAHLMRFHGRKKHDTPAVSKGASPSGTA